MLFDDLAVFIEWDGDSTPLGDGLEPTEHSYETFGNIIGLDEDEARIVIGRFKTCYVDADAANNDGFSTFDAFDARLSTVNYYSAIFDVETADPREDLEALVGGGMYINNVLIIERLEILPQYRGRSIGLLVMKRLIQRFGAGTGLVAIKPFPLQFEASRREEDEEWAKALALSGLDKNKRRSNAVLRRTYKRLGFKALKGTDYMFLSPGTAMPTDKMLLANRPNKK